jgi:hypothetical protein
MHYLKYILVVAASLALFACGNKSTTTGTGVISLNGGNGTSGVGGTGGAIVTMKNFSSAAMLIPGSATMTNFSSAVHGDLKFHAGGGVTATFAVPVISPDFGNNQAIISVETTVESTTQTTPGALYVLAGDPNLYLVNNAGVGVAVTGLTVNSTLHLLSNTVPTVIPKGIVINGTVTNTTGGEAINLQSGTFIQINGKVTTNPTTTPPGTGGNPGGNITLSSGGTLINLGTIDASGSDGKSVPGGASGTVTLQAANFLYNTNTIHAKGGNSDTGAGGAGGAIQLLAGAASVATSGAIDSSGGNGTSGGAAGPVTLSGGKASAIGRVSVEGTVNANGGNCTGTGAGGNGETVSLTSFSGGILVAATISANGGIGVGGIGGAGGSLFMKNSVGADSAGLHLVSPEGIKVAGNISLNGGNGTVGGNGGAIAVASDVVGNALQGFANVEFFGYQLITLNGGRASSNGGDGGTILAILSSPASIVNVDIPAGGVYDEVAITAIGGDNIGSPVKNAPGGNGGTLQFVTPQTGNTVDPARTLVNDTGSINISGGAGTSGGMGGIALMSGYGNVTCSGGITANGGTGTTQGGAGSPSIMLLSSSSVSSGGIVVSGGSGAQGGNGGNVAVAAGNQTSTGGISANGGSSTTGGNGGSGGSVSLLSEYALTVRGVVNVARGAGGSGNNATNGTVTVDGVTLATALPASGAI